MEGGLGEEENCLGTTQEEANSPERRVNMEERREHAMVAPRNSSTMQAGCSNSHRLELQRGCGGEGVHRTGGRVDKSEV